MNEQVQAATLLQWHCEWAADTIEDGKQLLLSGLWLYGVAARVDRPLSAATASQLRGLLRTCSHARSCLSPSDDSLPVLNVLLAVAGYFGQDEATVYLCRETHI